MVAEWLQFALLSPISFRYASCRTIVEQIGFIGFASKHAKSGHLSPKPKPNTFYWRNYMRWLDVSKKLVLFRLSVSCRFLSVPWNVLIKFVSYLQSGSSWCLKKFLLFFRWKIWHWISLLLLGRRRALLAIEENGGRSKSRAIVMIGLFKGLVELRSGVWLYWMIG